jgi:hypothetical protein
MDKFQRMNAKAVEAAQAKGQTVLCVFGNGDTVMVEGERFVSTYLLPADGSMTLPGGMSASLINTETGIDYSVLIEQVKASAVTARELVDAHQSFMVHIESTLNGLRAAAVHAAAS